MRKIMVSGFLGADAQKQISKQNREYVTFRMANREYNDPKGADGLTQATWVRVTCFNPNLLSFASNLKKGYNVTVIGDVNLSTYQNKMGAYSVDVDIFADSISFTGGGDSNRNSNSNSGSNQYSMPTTGNYGSGNTSKSYSAPSAPQASMPTATSMPTVTPSATAASTESSSDDDDLPF